MPPSHAGVFKRGRWPPFLGCPEGCVLCPFAGSVFDPGSACVVDAVLNNTQVRYCHFLPFLLLAWGGCREGIFLWPFFTTATTSLHAARRARRRSWPEPVAARRATSV